MDFLTPSQFISVLLLAGGLILLAIEMYVDGKKAVSETAEVSEEAEDAEVAEDAETPVAPAEGETNE